MNILSVLLSQATEDTNLLAPIVITPNVQTAINTLNLMVGSLQPGPFLDFLQHYVNYSVEVLGHCDNNILIPDTSYSFTLDTLNMLNHKPGVYMVHDLSNLNPYIGSAVDIVTRFNLHYNGLVSGVDTNSYHLALLDRADLANLRFSPLYFTENFHNIGAKLLGAQSYNMSVGEKQILMAFTQFLVRILEQSLIENFSNINPSQLINFDYTSWDPSLLSSHYTGIYDPNQFIEIRNEVTGQLYYLAQNFQDAADKLQCNLPKIRRYLNCATGFASTVFAARITLNVRGDKLLPLLTLPVPLTELAGYVVWAIRPDKKGFLGPYAGFLEANRKLNPTNFYQTKKTSIYNKLDDLKRHCNRDVLLQTEKGDFYIAVNPIKQQSTRHPLLNLPKRPW